MMHHTKPTPSPYLVLILAAALTACGGGDSGSGSSVSNDSPAVVNGNAPGGSSATSSQPSPAPESGAPQATGNTATDGFNWTNFRRQQLGLRSLTRNTQIDAAAQGHSNYQKTNNVISHEQNPAAPGFTGETLEKRLMAAKYTLKAPYAYGEVIAASTNPSGFQAAEDLITAIYHRFVMFEPRFREAGAGAATASAGYTYFTLNLATTNGLGQGLGIGRFVTYPLPDQKNILPVFYSDYESPDPVSDRNAVGYPVSIHADITATVSVQSFTIAPRGGTVLPVKLLTHTSDSHTSPSVAAIVPLTELAPKTTYDVRFVGTIDGIAASRSWSFTTQ